jgi:glycosyltransferase involved in cell wall biosynthesis
MNRLNEGAHMEYSDEAELVKRPEVSVVMPTYNHERYLAEAIEGVVRQETSFPIELLIGEDCSTDGTREIALSYQKRFPEMIRVITSERNVGGQENFARLVAATRGKYIASCEGDDFWHRPDKLQRQIGQFYVDDSLVCVSAGIRVVSADGDIIDGIQQINCDAKAIGIEYQDLIFETPFHPNTCTLFARASAMRRALTGNSLCSDHSLLMGDFPLWLELSQLGRMILLTEVLGSYRLSPHSATRRSDPLWCLRFGISDLELRYRALERYPLPGGDNQTSQAKLGFARRLLLGAARVGDRALARFQWRRIIDLGARPTLSDVARMTIAFTPLPRRSLTVGARRITRYLETRGCKRNGVLGRLLSMSSDFK